MGRMSKSKITGLSTNSHVILDKFLDFLGHQFIHLKNRNSMFSSNSSTITEFFDSCIFINKYMWRLYYARHRVSICMWTNFILYSLLYWSLYSTKKDGIKQIITKISYSDENAMKKKNLRLSNILGRERWGNDLRKACQSLAFCAIVKLTYGKS